MQHSDAASFGVGKCTQAQAAFIVLFFLCLGASPDKLEQRLNGELQYVLHAFPVSKGDAML